MVCQCRIRASDGERELERGLALLPPFLRPEVTRYHRFEDRMARLAARLLIRMGLRSLGLEGDSALEFWRREPQGRPFLLGGRAGISMSHAHPWTVAALTTNGGRVGIDVEMFQRPLDVDSILPYCSEAEAEHIRQAECPKESALHCWSMREAVLKADGRGLLAPEEMIRGISMTRTPAGRRWLVERLEFNDGCLYLAHDHEPAIVRREEWCFTDLLVR